ncbi:hypothetical protein BDQ12DRAFT_715575 [Crucibulum laeve]|uniref:Uncharacterized protein n=1 Tax=Crucibulum laeve TaxID=68775 RepID=A0A5C3LM97_9AGAR|nr:hypothetical protein BDQ12DRAFT_715575 [Crucibulum laeve]
MSLHGSYLPPPPPPLRYEAIPTPEELRSRIEPWVVFDFSYAMLTTPHDEKHTYGAINTLLGSIFPVSRRFKTTPQAVLCRAIPPDAVFSAPMLERDVSTGSSGAYHQSSEAGGIEHELQYTDFITAKWVSEPSTSMHVYYLMGIFEIKRDKDTLSEAEGQVKGYLMTAYPRLWRRRDLPAYLFIGGIGEVRKYVFGILENGNVGAVIARIFHLSNPVDAEALLLDLCSAASDCWNRSNVDEYPLA